MLMWRKKKRFWFVKWLRWWWRQSTRGSKRMPQLMTIQRAFLSLPPSCKFRMMNRMWMETNAALSRLLEAYVTKLKHSSDGNKSSIVIFSVAHSLWWCLHVIGFLYKRLGEEISRPQMGNWEIIDENGVECDDEWSEAMAQRAIEKSFLDAVYQAKGKILLSKCLRMMPFEWKKSAIESSLFAVAAASSSSLLLFRLRHLTSSSAFISPSVSETFFASSIVLSCLDRQEKGAVGWEGGVKRLLANCQVVLSMKAESKWKMFVPLKSCDENLRQIPSGIFALFFEQCLRSHEAWDLTSSKKATWIVEAKSLIFVVAHCDRFFSSRRIRRSSLSTFFLMKKSICIER